MGLSMAEGVKADGLGIAPTKYDGCRAYNTSEVNGSSDYQELKPINARCLVEVPTLLDGCQQKIDKLNAKVFNEGIVFIVRFEQRQPSLIRKTESPCCVIEIELR